MRQWQYGRKFTSGNLTFVRVVEGSHMLAYDLPHVALQLFENALDNNWHATTSAGNKNVSSGTRPVYFVLALMLTAGVVATLAWFVRRRHKMQHYAAVPAARQRLPNSESFELLDMGHTDEEELVA